MTKHLQWNVWRCIGVALRDGSLLKGLGPRDRWSDAVLNKPVSEITARALAVLLNADYEVRELGPNGFVASISKPVSNGIYDGVK